MAEGHGWGGASRAGSNHPALASASAAPPYPRRGALSHTYVAVYSTVFSLFPFLAECYGFSAFISISAVLLIPFSLAKSTADLPCLFLWDTFAPLSNKA
jgi:hypothetical protein